MSALSDDNRVNASRPGRLTIGVIGAGRVGAVLASALRSVGHTITAVSRASQETLDRVEVLLPGVPMLEIEERMHVSAYGLLGYSMLASQTLRDALQLEFAHPALLGTYFQLSLQEDQGTARIVARGYRYAPELTVFNTELCLASMLTVIRDLLGEPIQPTELLLPYRQPLHAQMYHEKLDCPVEFAAPLCALGFDARLLERPLPLADPVSCHNGLQQCLKLESQLNSGHDLLELIRQYLTRHLRGDGSLDAVAAYLNRSPRSLRRHLQELHTSYQQLLDEVRFEKARQMLQQTDLPIYLIAEHLGYSDTASFRTAFIRWSGLTPSRYRR